MIRSATAALFISILLHGLIAAGLIAYLEYAPHPDVLATLDLSSVELSFAEEERETQPVAPLTSVAADDLRPPKPKADDSIQLNGMDLSKADVIARVKELNAVKMKLPVLISGDRKSSLGIGIELLADLKAAGVEKASFQVSGETK